MELYEYSKEVYKLSDGICFKRNLKYHQNLGLQDCNGGEISTTYLQKIQSILHRKFRYIEFVVPKSGKNL